VASDNPVDSLASAADSPAASGSLVDSPAGIPVASAADNRAVARNPVATVAWRRGAEAAADFEAGRVVADS